MDIFGLVLTVRLKESLGNVRAPLRTALASWAPSINIIIIIIIIIIITIIISIIIIIIIIISIIIIIIIIINIITWHQ